MFNEFVCGIVVGVTRSTWGEEATATVTVRHLQGMVEENAVLVLGAATEAVTEAMIETCQQVFWSGICTKIAGIYRRISKLYGSFLFWFVVYCISIKKNCKRIILIDAWLWIEQYGGIIHVYCIAIVWISIMKNFFFYYGSLCFYIWSFFFM